MGSTALSTSTTRNFLLTWQNKINICPTMCKRSLRSTSNAVGWSMDSFECNAAPATRNGWLRLAASVAGFAPVAARGVWLRAQPCWWMMSCLMHPCASGRGQLNRLVTNTNALMTAPIKDCQTPAERRRHICFT